MLALLVVVMVNMKINWHMVYCSLKKVTNSFFNKDTYVDTMTPEENAIACIPIFN